MLLDHSPQQCIYLVLTTAEVTSINEVGVLLTPATIWCVKLKIPQEVGRFFEVWTHSVDFMD